MSPLLLQLNMEYSIINSKQVATISDYNYIALQLSNWAVFLIVLGTVFFTSEFVKLLVLHLGSTPLAWMQRAPKL